MNFQSNALNLRPIHHVILVEAWIESNSELCSVYLQSDRPSNAEI